MRLLVEQASRVLDTDVASFLLNRDPVRSARYERHVAEQVAVLPFAVVGEMLYGARANGWGAARFARLGAYLQAHGIVYPDYRLCTIWADLRAEVRRAGRVISPQDAWVAATALYLDVPIVTHNARHFVDVPRLRIITEPDLPGDAGPARAS